MDLEKIERTGAVSSGDLERIYKLPRDDEDLQDQALRVASLPAVQHLFGPQSLERFKDSPQLGWFVKTSPDPLVLPWCHAQGLQVDDMELLEGCILVDNLESVLYLLRVAPRRGEELKVAVETAYRRCARRVLKHFFLVQKVKYAVAEWQHTDFFEAAPSYRQALELLVELGLLDQVRPALDPIPLAPDLGYLKLVKKTLDWDIAEDERCIERLYLGCQTRWHSQTERCVLWLLEQGAKLTPEFLNLFLSPPYRISFAQKLLALGYTPAPNAYLALKDAPQKDFSERYWLLRRANVQPSPDTFLSVLPRAPTDVSQHFLSELNQPLSAEVLVGLVRTTESKLSELAELLPLLAPKCVAGHLPSALYAAFASRPSFWLDRKRNLPDLQLELVLAHFDWLRAQGCPLPQLSQADWQKLAFDIASPQNEWRRVQNVDVVLPLLLAWLVEHCGPVPDPRALFDALSHEDVLSDSWLRQGAASPKIVLLLARFLKSQGCPISDEEIDRIDNLANPKDGFGLGLGWGQTLSGFGA